MADLAASVPSTRRLVATIVAICAQRCAFGVGVGLGVAGFDLLQSLTGPTGGDEDFQTLKRVLLVRKQMRRVGDQFE